jgi:prophage antirepressor-like protein
MKEFTMKSQIKQFHSDEFGSLDVLMIDGKPYFPATECAKVLGYNQPQHAIKRHCVGDGCTKHTVIDRLGRPQEKRFISEGNLYRLIIRSNLPEAEQFERWVFDEVLPSIRKHGGYVTFDTLDEMLRSPKFTNEFLRKLNEERRKSAVWEELVVELTPMALYCDLILQSKTAIPVTLIAKDYGMSAARFNRILHIIGIQYRVGKTWVLYQKYAGKGYTQTRTYHIGENASSTQTCWTQRGRMFLYETLKGLGIVPLGEKFELAG